MKQFQATSGVMLLYLVLLAPLRVLGAPVTGSGVDSLADKLLAHMQQKQPDVRTASGLPITGFVPLTLEQAQADASFNKQMLARLEAIPLGE